VQRIAQIRSLKVLKKTIKLFLIIILSTGLISRALAGSQTGSIKGKVMDKEGLPLPGALIYVSSPALLGIRTYLATNSGKIRVPGLPPGRYKITAEMPGFKTANIENIIVRVGMIVTLAITLEESSVEEEITVKVPSPTLDRESIKTAVTVEKELLKNIPFSKNLHDVVHSVPGVVSEKSLSQDKSAVHGSSLRANTFAFEGMTMNDPAGRDLLADINFDVIEEVELKTAGHPAEVGLTQGGYINVVSKSGSNRTEGEFNFYYTDDTLSSYLRPSEKIRAPEVSPPVKDRYFWDVSFVLGGPLIEDMLWYFGNARLISRSQAAPFIPWTDPLGNEHRKFSWQDIEKMGFFKLSSRFVPQLKVSAMFDYANRYQSAWEPALSWNAPEEATYMLDHEKNLTAAGVINYIINQNTFADFRGGYFQQRIPFQPNKKGIETSKYFDEATGHLWGRNGFNEIQNGKRFQAGAYLTRFQDRLLGGDHELKAGAEFESAQEELSTWKEDNLMIHYYDGSPYYFGMDESPVSGNTVGKGKISFYMASQERTSLSPKSQLKRLSFFAQDSVSFGNRLTLLLGLRFDRSTTRLSNLYKGESGNAVSVKIGEDLIMPLYELNPYGLAGIREWGDLINWNALSPRIGLSLDIFGKGKTIFKASFSRYAEYLMLDYLSPLSPIFAKRLHQFYWFDENMDGKVDTEDTYALYPEDYRLYFEDYYKKQIAPDIKPPWKKELTIGLDHEVFQDFSLRINYLFKTQGNILENVPYDLDQNKDWYTKDNENWWIPFQTIVPGVDDYPATPVTVYFRSNSAPALFYRLKNVPELKRKYQALEMSFKKRMSNNWQLNGSLVLSRATGNIGLGYEGSSGFSEAADSPNYFVNLPEVSRLDFDRPFVARLIGTYRFSSNLYLSFFYTYASGSPWARSVTIIPPSSWAQEKDAWSSPAKVYLEKPGTRRTEAYNNLDLRIEKEFSLGKSGKWSAYVDIMNALGHKSSFNFPNDDGFWFPEAENTSQGIRDLSPNYKKTKLLFGTRIFRLSLNFRF